MQPPEGTKKVGKKTNERWMQFAQLIVAGKTQYEAYRQVYDESADLIHARLYGSRIAKKMPVREEIIRLRNSSAVKRLMSLNDRLAVLAEIAQNKKGRPSDRTRAIDVYSRISGDQAPERHEITGAEGSPIALAPLTANVNVTVTKADKIAALRAERAARQPVVSGQN